MWRLDKTSCLRGRVVGTFQSDLFVVIDVCDWKIRNMELGLAVKVDGKFPARKNCFGESALCKILLKRAMIGDGLRSEAVGRLELRVLIDSNESLLF